VVVVLGHCIQYGSGVDSLQSESFFDDPLFKWIYSYHMALFMLVSGYLFGLSMSRHTFRDICKSRFFQLIVPIVSWGTVVGVLTIVIHPEILSSLWRIIKTFGAHMILDIWFIWAIFYCSLVVLAVHRWLRDSIAVYMILYLLLFITPDALNFHLYKYMYPFFVTGYFAFDKLWWKKAMQYKEIIFIVAFIAYLFLFSYFNYNSYIYTSMYTMIDFESHEIHIWKAANDVYRMVVAALGSICIMMALKYIWDKSASARIWFLLQKLGRASLIIYIFGGIMNIFLKHVTSDFLGIDYMVCFLEMIVIVTLSYLVYLIIKRYHMLNMLLMGGR